MPFELLGDPGVVHDPGCRKRVGEEIAMPKVSLEPVELLELKVGRKGQASLLLDLAEGRALRHAVQDAQQFPK